MSDQKSVKKVVEQEQHKRKKYNRVEMYTRKTLFQFQEFVSQENFCDKCFLTWRGNIRGYGIYFDQIPDNFWVTSLLYWMRTKTIKIVKQIDEANITPALLNPKFLTKIMEIGILMRAIKI